MAAILFNSGVAFAERYPAVELAGHLNDLCKRTDSGSKAVCFGFIGGVFEVAANNAIDGIQSCAPPVNVSMIKNLTLKWIFIHPEKGVEPASRAIAEAMAEAFPCQKSHGK
ncbi:MAG TPA: Rap1a/Tai family immunity protein [Terracidiphilus sp.]|jgi:hypothetical protein